MSKQSRWFLSMLNENNEEKKVYKIEIQKLEESEIPSYLKRIVELFKKDINPDLKYDQSLMPEDIYIPQRPNN